MTEEQKKKLADLESEVKGKLEKILTADQIKQIEQMPPPGPPNDGPDGPPKGKKDGGKKGGKKDGEKKGDDKKGDKKDGDKKGDDDGPKKGKGRPEPENEQSKSDIVPSGIQWFATWDAGRAEANRTVKPILLVSAAPHCAGVSGIW